MIPSLEELRNSLVPEFAPDTACKQNSQSSTESAGSIGPSSSEFLVLNRSSSLFAPRGTLMCKLCMRRPETCGYSASEARGTPKSNC